MFRTAPMLALLTLTATFYACSEKPTPDDIHQRTSSTVNDFINESKSFDALYNLEAFKPLADFLTNQGVKIGENGLPGSSSSPTADIDREKLAEEIDTFLERYIFAKENVESENDDSITFLIHGSLICPILIAESSSDCVSKTGSPTSCNFGESETQAIEECQKMIDALQIRIKATLSGDNGVNLEVSLGGGQSVLGLMLQPGNITLQLSLPGLRDTVQHVAQVTGEDDIPPMPEVMKGILALSLIRNAAQDFTMKLNILDSIDIQGKMPEGDYLIQTEKRNAVIDIHLQGEAKAVTLSTDWGTTKVSLPAKAFLEKATGQFHFLLSGLSATMTANEEQKLTIAKIGLGPEASSVTLNDQTLIEVNLNANAGRQFNLEIVPWQDLPRCAVDPQLELEVKLNLQTIEAFLDEPLESWARNEVYRLSLSNTDGKAEVIPIAESQDALGGLKVLQGVLSLQSSVQPAKVEVPAGSCLMVTESKPEDSHPLLGYFKSVPCQ